MNSADVVIIGVGPTALTGALLVARAGARVLLLDRDTESEPTTADQAWSSWSRPGVNQFRQAHIPLPRWHRIMVDELPEVVTALRELGGTEMNLLHRHSVTRTGLWRPGDEIFTTIAARRPVLEAALARVAADHPRISVRRGVRVTGLVTESERGSGQRVVGVRTGAETIRAGLVVDAAGTRTPVPAWLAGVGVAPLVERSSVPLTYYTRHYSAPSGPPTATGAVLTHHESYAVLTLPADNGTWGVAIVVGSADHATRGLRDNDRWEAAVRATGAHPRWIAGTPLTDVRPLAGLHDVVRDYAPGGVPVIRGLVPLGDAWCTTSPFLGRGLSLGALGAAALRDAISRPEVETVYAGLLAERVLPYVQATIAFGRHRAAELAAEAAGEPYRTEDPAWAASRALATGADHDPVLLRAHARLAGLLASPAEVFADGDVRRRLQPHLQKQGAAPPYPADRPGRLPFLAAIRGRQFTNTPEGVPA